MSRVILFLPFHIANIWLSFLFIYFFTAVLVEDLIVDRVCYCDCASSIIAEISEMCVLSKLKFSWNELKEFCVFFFNSAYQYFLSFIVLLGSTPEVPAGSCQEIKASEGEEAATGKYWLNSNRSSYLVRFKFLVMIIHQILRTGFSGLFRFSVSPY